MNHHHLGSHDLGTEAFAVSNAAFAECQVTEAFLSEHIRPAVQSALGPTPSDVDATWLGLLLRNIAWLRSLGKLNDPGDFQAVSVAARTLFQVAVDVTLMHFDPQSPPEKLRAWEDSAKLKSAEALKRFHDEASRDVPEEHTPQMQFIEREGQRVRHLRTQFWNGKHPRSRWTDRNLREDAREATRWAKRAEFEEFYLTKYPTLCWNTHGSGLVGVRLLNESIFPMVSGEALAQCADFSMFVAEVLLVHLGTWDIEWAKRLARHNRYRFETKVDAYREAVQRRTEPTNQGG